MQKVVGSSPIIRSKESPGNGAFFFVAEARAQGRNVFVVRFESGQMRAASALSSTTVEAQLGVRFVPRTKVCPCNSTHFLTRICREYAEGGHRYRSAASSGGGGGPTELD